MTVFHTLLAGEYFSLTRADGRVYTRSSAHASACANPSKNGYSYVSATLDCVIKSKHHALARPRKKRKVRFWGVGFGKSSSYLNDGVGGFLFFLLSCVVNESVS